MRRGIIFVIVAPSGAGKSSIVARVLERVDNLRFSVSFTSREPRMSERDGQSYHFVNREEFEQKIGRGEFLEWAVYVDNYYGTDARLTEEALSAGVDVLMDIDIQGADSVKRVIPDCVRIFILPPGRAELERRLRDRGANTEAEMRKRIRAAANEVTRAPEFDYVVVNDVLEEAADGVVAIIRSERRRAVHARTLIGEMLQSFQEEL